MKIGTKPATLIGDILVKFMKIGTKRGSPIGVILVKIGTKRGFTIVKSYLLASYNEYNLRYAFITILVSILAPMDGHHRIRYTHQIIFLSS